MPLFEVYNIQNINITKAKGSYVWDESGQKYLDMYGGHAVISIGHLHDHWQSMLKAQLDKIAFYSNSVIITVQEELATKLGEVSGKKDYQLFLCNSGAEANENALKLASFYNGRKKIVTFSGAFHGRTSLAVAATDNPAIVAPVNYTGDIIRLPFNDLEALHDCFDKHGHEIAAVIAEGIQGIGGIYEASDAFLQSIRKLCDQYRSVYVADSVQCGYGRSGTFFSHDAAGVQADIYTMAKGMGNGFPIGGIFIAPKFSAKKGMLGTTFGGNHLACTAAVAVLDVIANENLIENAQEIGQYIIKKLKSYPEVKEVRGRGLMIGFEMNEPFTSTLKKDLLNKRHIFTGEAKNNTIRLLPSLAIKKEEADQFFEAFESLINQN
ncbi:MAG: aminotransferase class III-fold pyridoxal phosphate-dependent enzyme [Saprospiraceae bacterium]